MKRAFDGDLREVGKKMKVITTFDKLPPVSRMGEMIAVDIETHGIDNEVIDLVSFSDGKTTAVIEWDKDIRDYLSRMFALPKRIFVFHNSPFDLPRLVANGVNIAPSVIETSTFDTMFGGVQVQPDLHKALGRMASLYLDIEPWKTSSRKETSHWRAMVKSDPKMYAAKDSFNTYWIAVQLIAIMKDLGVWNYFMGQNGHPGPGVMATLPELAEMSRGGLRTNREYAREVCPKLEKRLMRYLTLWTQMFPNIRFSSNPQLQKLLYRQWGLPIQRNKEDGVSVDELALVKLQAFVRDNRENGMLPGKWQTDPRAVPRTFDLMYKLRKTSKMLSTYVQPVMFSEESWVHPSYLPASKDDERGGKKMDNKGATATGRLASFKPNIQNQMKEKIGNVSVRHLYVPDSEDMCFVQADYKSAELYVLAGVSGDKRLLADLAGDMHQRNADRLTEVLGELVTRKVAKNVTYASQYLASPAKQSEMILEQEHLYISPAQCLSVSEGIWGYYTKATAYKQLLVELCESQRYITNPFGRTRFFHAGRAPAAVDFIPQSVVADILWCVLKDVAMMLRSYGGRLVTTVHDSILGCVPAIHREEAAYMMKEIMERRFDCVRKGFYIPVEIEMGEAGASWAELKKWEAA
jgi:DNA polymerase I-like protein with 3'-5' exonuclease and polymerase domains